MCLYDLLSERQLTVICVEMSKPLMKFMLQNSHGKNFMKIMLTKGALLWLGTGDLNGVKIWFWLVNINNDWFSSPIFPSHSHHLFVRNATLDWPAMSELNYEWIKNAYLRWTPFIEKVMKIIKYKMLFSDPEILNYEDKECWYNNYKTKHLNSLRSVFRYALKFLPCSTMIILIQNVWKWCDWFRLVCWMGCLSSACCWASSFSLLQTWILTSWIYAPNQTMDIHRQSGLKGLFRVST